MNEQTQWGGNQPNNNNWNGYQQAPNQYNPYGGPQFGPGGPMPPQPGAQIVPSPGFIECIKLFFNQYATFTGRSRRSEYWYAFLFQIIVSMVISFLQLPFVGNIVSLALIIPNLALQCRRLHDIGRSGNWIWIQILSSVLFMFSFFYLMLFMLYNYPQVAMQLREQGVDVSSFESLYGILNVPGSLVIFLFLAAVGIWIMFLVFNCTDSQKGPNQYGQSPKYPGV